MVYFFIGDFDDPIRNFGCKLDEPTATGPFRKLVTPLGPPIHLWPIESGCFFLFSKANFLKHPLRWLSFFQENLKPAKILKEKKHQEMKPNKAAKRGGTPKYSQVLIKFCFDEIKKHVKHHCCKDLQKNPKETPSRMVVSWSPTHEFFLVVGKGRHLAWRPHWLRRIPSHYAEQGSDRWLGGGFEYFLFSALFGEMIQFD